MKECFDCSTYVVMQINVVSIIMWCISSILLIIGGVMAHKYLTDNYTYEDIDELAFACVLFGGGFAYLGCLSMLLPI